MKKRVAVAGSTAILVGVLSWLISLAVPSVMGATPPDSNTVTELNESEAVDEIWAALQCDGELVRGFSVLWHAASPGESSRELAAIRALTQKGVDVSSGDIVLSAGDRLTFRVARETKAILTAIQPPAGGWVVDSGFLCTSLLNHSSS